MLRQRRAADFDAPDKSIAGPASLNTLHDRGYSGIPGPLSYGAMDIVVCHQFHTPVG